MDLRDGDLGQYDSDLRMEIEGRSKSHHAKCLALLESDRRQQQRRFARACYSIYYNLVMLKFSVSIRQNCTVQLNANMIEISAKND